MYGIYTREEIIEEQKEWVEYDLSKNKDFSHYPFWVVASDGETEGFDTFEEAEQFAKTMN